ncbi:hypothetical protein HMPREF0666_01251, partial [Prevotella sp. C561]
LELEARVSVEMMMFLQIMLFWEVYWY